MTRCNTIVIGYCRLIAWLISVNVLSMVRWFLGRLVDWLIKVDLKNHLNHFLQCINHPRMKLWHSKRLSSDYGKLATPRNWQNLNTTLHFRSGGKTCVVFSVLVQKLPLHWRSGIRLNYLLVICSVSGVCGLTLCMEIFSKWIRLALSWWLITVSSQWKNGLFALNWISVSFYTFCICFVGFEVLKGWGDWQVSIRAAIMSLCNEDLTAFVVFQSRGGGIVSQQVRRPGRATYVCKYHRLQRRLSHLHQHWASIYRETTINQTVLNRYLKF